MRYVGLILFAVVLLAVGFVAGKQYGLSQQEYQAEAIIGNEVALLERYKGIPDCAKARNVKDQWNIDRVNSAAVVWT